MNDFYVKCKTGLKWVNFYYCGCMTVKFSFSLISCTFRKNVEYSSVKNCDPLQNVVG